MLLSGLGIVECTPLKKLKWSLVKENADPVANGKASGRNQTSHSLDKKEKATPHEQFSFIFSKKVDSGKQTLISKRQSPSQPTFHTLTGPFMHSNHGLP